jgi:hypothetical protein
MRENSERETRQLRRTFGYEAVEPCAYQAGNASEKSGDEQNYEYQRECNKNDNQGAPRALGIDTERLLSSVLPTFRKYQTDRYRNQCNAG